MAFILCMIGFGRLSCNKQGDYLTYHQKIYLIMLKVYLVVILSLLICSTLGTEVPCHLNVKWKRTLNFDLSAR